MPIRLSVDRPKHVVCLDTGATVLIIDEDFLARKLPDLKPNKLQMPFHIRGVGKSADLCTYYVELDMWVPASVKGERILAHIKHKVHITRNLKPKMLIAMDIIGPELIKIDIPRKLATLGACQKAKMPLLVKRKDQVRFRTAVRAQKSVVILPKSLYEVPIKTQSQVPLGRNFEFVPHEFDIKAHQAGIGIYRHVVDDEFNFVLIRNDADVPITVLEDMRLGSIAECELAGCYILNPKDHGLAALTAYPDCPDPGKETKLENGITIYGD